MDRARLRFVPSVIGTMRGGADHSGSSCNMATSLIPYRRPNEACAPCSATARELPRTNTGTSAPPFRAFQRRTPENAVMGQR